MAGNFYDDIYKGINYVKDNFKFGKNDEPILHSNKAIREVGKFFLGETDTGIRGTLAGLSSGKGFNEAVKEAYTTAEGGLNYKAIAGTYIGGSIAGRVATGGGIYKDRNGNSNLMGVPFV